MEFDSPLETYLFSDTKTNRLQSCYKLMKDIVDKNYGKWIQAKCSYFTDHGIDHIESVITTASEMILPMINSEELNKVEAFLLLSSILWHDAAMIYQRAEHADNAKKILADFKVNFPNDDFVKIVRSIVWAHSGRDGLKRPKEEQRISFENRNYVVKPKLLAAVLRLADELSENKSRVSSSIMEIMEMIPSKNKIFWHYANSITASYPSPEERVIKIIYSVDKSSVAEYFQSSEFENRLSKNGCISLIEYIICRLEKVNNERIYCSECMEPYLEFKEVIAEITIYDGFDSIDGLDSVPFTFRDSGIYKKGEYPNSNVYELFFNKHGDWKPDSLRSKLQNI